MQKVCMVYLHELRKSRSRFPVYMSQPWVLKYKGFFSFSLKLLAWKLSIHKNVWSRWMQGSRGMYKNSQFMTYRLIRTSSGASKKFSNMCYFAKNMKKPILHRTECSFLGRTSARRSIWNSALVCFIRCMHDKSVREGLHVKNSRFRTSAIRCTRIMNVHHERGVHTTCGAPSSSHYQRARRKKMP